jgi:phosphoesterase RecJ-like protein
MELTTHQQIINLIEKSQNILLLTHAKADADGLGSMLSMHQILKDMGKEVTAATNDPTGESLNFLPFINVVQNSIAGGKDFVITVDISKTPLNKIKYAVSEDSKHVNIIISPKEGLFTASDVKFGASGAKFDLIMTFDTGNLEHLGPIYDQNTELFFQAPIINVDHHASNTSFGQVNLVDVISASATQVTFALLKEMEKHYNKKLINPDIATLLLAGIITDTGSFQHANTSPNAMETAAELLDLGARQQEIIRHIYKTKKLSTLKLWGIVLSKVQVDPLHRMVWSTISKQDLMEAGAESEETGTIIDDLLSNAPGGEVIMLIKEQLEGYISVSMRSTTDSVNVGKICGEFGGGGHVRAAGFKIRDGKPLEEVAAQILTAVRKYQKERLNLQEETKPAPAPVIMPKVEAPKKEETKPAENKPAKPAGVRKETPLEFKAPKPKTSQPKPQPKVEAPKPAPKKEEPKKEDKPKA